MSIRIQHIRGTTSEIEGVTPLPAEIGYDTDKKEPHIGDGATAGGVRLAKKNIREILTPAQITADTADYNPADQKHADTLIISSDAARLITGLVPTTVTDGVDGRTITLYNAGSFNITLKNQSGSSTAANRFDLNGSDLVLSSKSSATLRYRSAVSRWELVAQTAGATVSAGAVIARTLAASSQGFSLINGTVETSVGSGALTVAIKTLAGNDPSATDPVHILVRDATLADGGYTMLSLTAATSLVVSSGSSLGAPSGTAFALRLVGINDDGTFRLGVINLGRGGAALPLLRTDQLVTSTAEGGSGGADSANVLYTGTAVASKPFAMIADLDWSSGLTAAGTWDATPSQIQLYDARMDWPGYGAAAIAKRSTGLFGGKIVESHPSNAVTFAIKTLAGNDPSVVEPVYATFQDGAGGLVVRTITSASSLTISSGSTLGFTSAEASRVWLVLIDTGSAAVLGVVNCRSGVSVMGLVDGVTYTTTAEGGAGGADSAQVIYSAIAQASKYLCIAGYADYDSGLTAAGTWDASPSRMIVFAPGMPRPGDRVQRAHFATGAVATGTGNIPLDDTLPQSTEGDQYMSLSVAPLSAANLLAVSARAILSASLAGRQAVALFRDSGINAIAGTVNHNGGTTAENQYDIDRTVLAGSTASTAFKLRASSAGGTATFNGDGGIRIFTNVANSFMEATELMG